VNKLSSPRLHVLIDDATVPARVLAELESASALAFSELRERIASGAPVLDVEMFTNDWYDSGAARLLDLLSGWEADDVAYILRETFTEPGDGEVAGEASQITLDELRNMIRSSEEERARTEELDGLRDGGCS